MISRVATPLGTMQRRNGTLPVVYDRIYAEDVQAYLSEGYVHLENMPGIVIGHFSPAWERQRPAMLDYLARSERWLLSESSTPHPCKIEPMKTVYFRNRAANLAAAVVQMDAQVDEGALQDAAMMSTVGWSRQNVPLPASQSYGTCGPWFTPEDISKRKISVVFDERIRGRMGEFALPWGQSLVAPVEIIYNRLSSSFPESYATAAISSGRLS